MNNKKIGGVRLDYQLSTDTRLMGKVSAGRLGEPFGLGTSSIRRDEYDVRTQQRGARPLSQVLNNHTLNEVKVGYAFFNLENHNLTTWSNHWQSANGITTGLRALHSPALRLPATSSTLGTRTRMSGASATTSRISTTRAAVTTCAPVASSCVVIRSRQTAGSAWGRSLPTSGTSAWPSRIAGADPLPALFPDAFNADTWNLAAISPLVSTSSGLGDFDVHMVSQKAGCGLRTTGRSRAT